jgi:hypothetical protein
MPNRTRLKVFQAQLGFYDSVVAAPSQAAALKAWGTRQNLFAEGQARVIDDPRTVAAALVHPGQPLRRAAGSSEPYGLEPGLPQVPKLARPKGAPAAKPAKTPAPKPRPAPDRRALDKAEAQLKSVNDRRIAEEADIARRRDLLDAEDERARRNWSTARAAAERAVEQARAAYEQAGG